MIAEKHVSILILHNYIIISKIKKHQVMRSRTNSIIKKSIHFSI
jgi:hypothetical protein